jgi:hypothetical protein
MSEDQNQKTARTLHIVIPWRWKASTTCHRMRNKIQRENNQYRVCQRRPLALGSRPRRWSLRDMNCPERSAKWSYLVVRTKLFEQDVCNQSLKREKNLRERKREEREREKKGRQRNRKKSALLPGLEPGTFRLTAERATGCATEAQLFSWVLNVYMNTSEGLSFRSLRLPGFWGEWDSPIPQQTCINFQGLFIVFAFVFELSSQKKKSLSKPVSSVFRPPPPSLRSSLLC